MSLRTGARGRLSGEDLLEAIKQGRLWVNLREVERGWPELWAAAMKDFAAIQATYPGMRAVRNAQRSCRNSRPRGASVAEDAARVTTATAASRPWNSDRPGSADAQA